MDLDLKGSSIKRIMDNPGLAFLTQLINKTILEKIYGAESNYYIDSINYNVLTSHKLISMAVYSEREEFERKSIERKFFLPENVPLKLLYFYFYVNFRDKIIPLLATACKANWESFESSEKLQFLNKINIHSQINMFISNSKGNDFIEIFKSLLSSMDYKRTDDEAVFDKVNEVSRSQLFYEFALLMGDAENYPMLREFKDPDNGLIKILSNKIINEKIIEMKFADKKERLFNLSSLDSIDDSNFANHDDSILNSYEVFKNRIIAMLFNPSFIFEKSLKLKKCLKIPLRLKIDNDLSLTDCLSTLKNFLNL